MTIANGDIKKLADLDLNEPFTDFIYTAVGGEVVVVNIHDAKVHILEEHEPDWFSDHFESDLSKRAAWFSQITPAGAKFIIRVFKPRKTDADPRVRLRTIG